MSIKSLRREEQKALHKFYLLFRSFLVNLVVQENVLVVFLDIVQQEGEEALIFQKHIWLICIRIQITCQHEV